MPLLDFDSLVICNDDHNIESLGETFRHFYDLGIRKFIVTFATDLSNDSWTSITNNYKRFKNAITSLKPRSTKINIAYNVHISPGISLNPTLHKLTLAKTNKLFIQTPLFVNDTWFSPDINYFLYKQKLSPIFTCFERNFISCDPNFSTKLYKIPKAAYCIDINYMTSFVGITHVKAGMRTGAIILPSVSNNYSSYIAELNRFKIMSDRMGRIMYLKFCKYINDCCKKVFGLF